MAWAVIQVESGAKLFGKLHKFRDFGHGYPDLENTPSLSDIFTHIPEIFPFQKFAECGPYRYDGSGLFWPSEHKVPTTIQG